jgi:Lon protease-like protein
LLAVSLPFHPAEKQALLEAADLKAREQMLVNLLRLAASPVVADFEIPPRTLN